MAAAVTEGNRILYGGEEWGNLALNELTVQPVNQFNMVLDVSFAGSE